MKKEGKKNRTNNIIVAILTGLFLIIVTVINCNNNNSEKPSNENVVIDSSVIEDNHGTLNKTNVGNNSGTINIGSETTNIYQSKSEIITGYAIKGSSELLKRLNQSDQVIVNQNSKKSIELSYSGELVEISKDSEIYIYNGGYLKAIINDESCKNLKELKLDYIKANTKNKIESELRNRIDEHVKSNFLLIQKAILECI